MACSFSFGRQYFAFLSKDSRYLFGVGSIRARHVLKQPKGGDPMSSEKPGRTIGSVSKDYRTEQPLRAI